MITDLDFLIWYPAFLSLFIFLFLCLIIFSKKFKKYYFNKLHNAREKENKNFKNTFVIFFFLIIMFVYLLITSILFGFSIISIIDFTSDSYKLTPTSSFNALFELPTSGVKFLLVVIPFVILIYGLLLIPLIKVFNLTSSSRVMVTITMQNGTVYHNKYILNSDIDGFMLISDENNKEVVKKHMIPKNNILEISCNTIYTTFGRDLVRSSKIILPKDFDNTDTNKLINFSRND